MFGGGIHRWLLLFQEYDFEIIVNQGSLNVGLDNILMLETRKELVNMDDSLPYA